MTGAAQENASTREGIVWLASYPKSGNTWTRTFLHNLLHIVYDEAYCEQDINAMGEYTSWDVSGKAFSEIIGKNVTQVTRDEIAAARQIIQQQLADKSEGLVFVKTHNALVMDRGFSTINPAVSSGAIYIVRNPLDVAISYAHHVGGTIDDAIDQMGRENLETGITEKTVYEVYGSWSQHVLSWTRKPNRAVYVLRYEDMLARPAKTFGALANHLLMTPTRKQLLEAIELSSFDKLQKQEESEGFKEKPKMAKVFFRAGKAGQWRDELTEEQIHRIVSAHKDQMKRFGYLPDGFK